MNWFSVLWGKYLLPKSEWFLLFLIELTERYHVPPAEYGKELTTYPLCWKMHFLPSELVSEGIVSSDPSQPSDWTLKMFRILAESKCLLENNLSLTWKSLYPMLNLISPNIFECWLLFLKPGSWQKFACRLASSDCNLVWGPAKERNFFHKERFSNLSKHVPQVLCEFIFLKGFAKW